MRHCVSLLLQLSDVQAVINDMVLNMTSMYASINLSNGTFIRDLRSLISFDSRSKIVGQVLHVGIHFSVGAR